MCGISGINGASSCGSQRQQVVNIDGQQITLTGDPNKDAKNAAKQLGCDEQTAAAKIEAVVGKPQQQPQKNNGVGTFDIGNAMLGY